MKSIHVIVIVVIFILVWGLIGSSQVSEIGNTCDIGINNQGSIFCWKWHQNVIGDLQERLNDLGSG